MQDHLRRACPSCLAVRGRVCSGKRRLNDARSRFGYKSALRNRRLVQSEGQMRRSTTCPARSRSEAVMCYLGGGA